MPLPAGRSKPPKAFVALAQDASRGYTVRASRVKNRNNNCIKIRSAAEHNLKLIDVTIPLNRLVCVTGVSGSGKPSEARRSAEGDPNGRAESDERVQCTLAFHVGFA